MTTHELIEFLGYGLIYALILTGAGILGSWALGRMLGMAWWPAVFLTSFFVTLTHHPFPDTTTLDCAAGGQPSRLVPFRFVGDVHSLWERGVTWTRWAHDLTISSAAMNLFLCATIGAALAKCLPRFWQVASCGVVLTLLIETSQITGIFGIYPCSYRTFDVDDIILNVLGVILGCALRLYFVRRKAAHDVERRTN